MGFQPDSLAIDCQEPSTASRHEVEAVRPRRGFDKGEAGVAGNGAESALTEGVLDFGPGVAALEVGFVEAAYLLAIADREVQLDAAEPPAGVIAAAPAL